jgi:hypothetical protein
VKQGTFNLAEFIECEGGRAADLPAIPFTVTSALPPGTHINLEREAASRVSVPSARAWPIYPLFAAWLALPLLWWLWHRLRAPRALQQPATAPSRSPHHVLIDAVGTRAMTVAERGRLEMLTLRELELRSLAGQTATSDRDPREMYRRLRLDPHARPLVDALEQWLHHPSSTDADAQRLRELLQAAFLTPPKAEVRP